MARLVYISVVSVASIHKDLPVYINMVSVTGIRNDLQFLSTLILCLGELGLGIGIWEVFRVRHNCRRMLPPPSEYSTYFHGVWLVLR